MGDGKLQLPGLSVGNAAAVDAALTAAEAVADDEVVMAARARLSVRLSVLTNSLERLLQHVFGLLERLTEVGVVSVYACIASKAVCVVGWVEVEGTGRCTTYQHSMACSDVMQQCRAAAVAALLAGVTHCL